MKIREEHQEFLVRVREAGRKINPEAARIRAEKGYVLNVYALYPFGEDNYGAINYFAFRIRKRIVGLVSGYPRADPQSFKGARA